jgi:hypothetical protein
MPAAFPDMTLCAGSTSIADPAERATSERNFAFGEIVRPSLPCPDHNGLVSVVQMSGLDVLDLISSPQQAADVVLAKVQCGAKGLHVPNSRALHQPIADERRE